MAAELNAKAEEIEQYGTISQGSTIPNGSIPRVPTTSASKAKFQGIDKDVSGGNKRRCVSTACIACRRRKSKCDGNLPSCAACSSVYNTECVYDPHSDHRRKGVYKKDIDNLKTRNSTLQTLIQAILNYPEAEVPDLVRQIRSGQNLDDVAESIMSNNKVEDEESRTAEEGNHQDSDIPHGVPQFEKELSGNMRTLRLDNGSVSIVGGTSNLIFLGPSQDGDNDVSDELEEYTADGEPIASWTEVTSDPRLVLHLTNMYFTWHYTFFTTLSKTLFWRDFKQGKPSRDSRHKTEYCTPLLVNAILALGCHFTSWPAARALPEDPATAGDHFFKEAKRLILQNDEHENPRITTVQALALMSVREAGCGREAKGWVYSGMSFRMAYDLGLNVGDGAGDIEETEIDARKITIWGCFLFDKCWSNYLGRQPQLPLSSISVSKFDVFPMEDADVWRPHTDAGIGQSHVQPSRTRAVALQISKLCEISSDLLLHFYHPHLLENPVSKQAELKKLSELHTRLEAWNKVLPKEFEPREGQLPNVLIMHMFFHLLHIHLFRPFLKYKPTTSPLPSYISPRKLLTQAANSISKLLRLYRRTYGLRQICNIVVYITHSACTVHLLNLPDKFATRDIVHGLNHLEEISDSWPCARRTLGILHQVSMKWAIDLPEAAHRTFERVDAKFGFLKSHDRRPSPASHNSMPPPPGHNVVPSSNANSLVVPNESYISPTAAETTSPTVSPVPPLDGAFSLPHHQSSSPGLVSRLEAFSVPRSPHQQNQDFHPSWGPDHASTGVTSPTIMLGGVDGIAKAHEWWLQDSQQIYANWNGYDQQQHDDPASAGSEYVDNHDISTSGSMGGAHNDVDLFISTNNGVPGSGMYDYGAYGFAPMSNYTG